MKSSKIAIIILSVALLLASVIGISISAEEATPTLEIYSKNLSYGSNISIAFAVKSDNIGDAEVKLNVYEADPTENSALAPAATVSKAYEETVHGAECDVFFTPGVNAKSIHRQVYVQAVATVDGETYYSEVERYSVLEYCYEMIADEDTDAAKDAKFQAVIDYGVAIQSLLKDDGKFEGAFANEYKYVTIAGGTLDGKYNAGVYLAGTKLTPYCEGVSAWSDGNVAVLNGGEYTVYENAVLDVANAKDLATESFENATSNALPSNISFVDTLPKIGNLGNSYKNSAYVVGQFTNNDTNSTKCLFTSNQYAASKAIIKIGESINAENNADMVEFEADLCLDWNTNGDNCEFFNLVLTDKDGNAAYNLVLRNMINGNRLIVLSRDSSGSMSAKGTQTFMMNADNVWFNLRVTYKYVDASTIAVEIFLNGNSIRTETVPATAGGAISVENLTNAYIVVNGNSGGGAHAINSHVAVDNVVFRKIAE